MSVVHIQGRIGRGEGSTEKGERNGATYQGERVASGMLERELPGRSLFRPAHENLFSGGGRQQHGQNEEEKKGEGETHDTGAERTLPLPLHISPTHPNPRT